VGALKRSEIVRDVPLHTARKLVSTETNFEDFTGGARAEKSPRITAQILQDAADAALAAEAGSTLTVFGGSDHGAPGAGPGRAELGWVRQGGKSGKDAR
jgi:hypothetical protein